MKSLFEKFYSIFGIKFVREVGILQIGKSIALVAGFAGSIVFARVLGPDIYGIYAISVSFVGVVTAFIKFGAWSTTVTLISEAIGRNDKDEVRNLVIYFLKITLLVTNGFWLLVLIFAPQLVSLVYSDISFSTFVRLNILANILAVAFLLLILSYQVFRKINRVAALESIKKITAVGIGVFFVISGWGVIGIFYGLLFAELIFLGVAIVLLPSLASRLPLFPSVKEIAQNFWKVKISRYLKFGLQVAVDKNLNNFVVDLPTFMLGVLSTPQQAGIFKVAHSVGMLPKVLSGTISRMLSTIFPFKEAKDPGTLHLYYRRVAKYGTILTFVMIGAVAAGTFFLFEFFYGKEYLSALPSLYIVLATNLLLGFAVSFSPIVRTLKKMAASIKLNILALILTIIIGLLAIPKYGALGAAFSTAGWFIVSIILVYKIEGWLKN